MKTLLYTLITTSFLFCAHDGFTVNVQNDAQHKIKIDVKHPTCNGPCMSETLDSKLSLNTSKNLKKGATLKIKPLNAKARPASCSVPNKELKASEYHNVKVHQSKSWKFFGVDKLKCKVEIRNPRMDAKDMEKFVKKMNKKN
ncbi:MAG: hypothetical protein Q8L85_06485 [Alphaproteobacteria bacterium]|jgi:hypothetical protein|nr:hypothetical protein [Alphaproteobacteria bacterium]